MSIIWPRSNSFEFDDDGVRAQGAKVYFFDAGTSTPKTAYQDADLTTPHAHPVVADGNGRWPAVFLDYGAYKELATTSGGTELWSTDDIPNTAPTDPGAGVDANSIFQTGDIIVAGKNGTRAGFVRLNGRTIGSAASVATERANADTEDLFEYVWNNYANGQAAVSGGRGASAAADFAANKTIALPDYRAVALTGFDDMGNSAASLYGSAPTISGSGILAGSLMGANTHTILEAQLPTHAHAVSLTSGAEAAHTHAISITSASDGGHTPSGTVTDDRALAINTRNYSITLGGGASQDVSDLNAAPNTQEAVVITNGADNTFTLSMDAVAAHTHSVSGTSAAGSSHTHSVSGNTGNIGSGTAHNNMARSAPVTFLMKL